jgi:hypothetical protein
MNAPVLLIIYKRPDLTRRALTTIAAAMPSRVFVAADGPRSATEFRACRDTRAVVNEFRDRLEIVTSFADENLGCGIRIHTAISWAFTQTEELIILEDDCVPNASFFRFCNDLLEHYRADERVMHVSGDNFVGRELSGPHSYYFSKYTHASGWATWRRAWRFFDWSIARWPELKANGILDASHHDPLERRYWSEIYDRLHAGDRDVWDLQWNLAVWSQSGLAALPSVNLVLNDGWGPDATHTKTALDWPAAEELGPIEHPPYIIRNERADAITFDRNFGGAAMRAADSPRARFRRRISPLLGPARLVKRALRRMRSRS